MIEYSFSIQELEVVLLYFVRVTCFIYAAPFYSMNNTPNQFKIGLGLFVSYLLYAVSLPHQELVYGTVLEYAVIVMREAIVGLIVSIFQTATSIQEQTLTFVPKIVSVFVTLMILGHWMLNQMTNLMVDMWSDFSIYIR